MRPDLYVIQAARRSASVASAAVVVPSAAEASLSDEAVSMPKPAKARKASAAPSRSSGATDSYEAEQIQV